MTTGSVRPDWPEGDLAYSNCDHRQDLTDDQVRKSGEYHQHAAWDFCGYLWWDSKKKKFIEEVWQHGGPVEVIEGESVAEVVSEANNRYGMR